ncbi:uncharacterized protein LOC100561372 isoform X2 [Anolis carolinensis]|nr:PREDICTED: rho guanine nucleotide exchange factor 5 isoform X2 [Anolis carolinensis]|eukprot:XP_008109556.1 PREDICTED: rho guanine nucleotide exchange factor 5 isoform X2 [Anolis carolinensis]
MLMEPTKIKRRHSFPPPTNVFHEASGTPASRRHNSGLHLITMSKLSEEQVAEKKEVAYFSEDLPLFFVVEEQIRGTFSNSFEKETPVALERRQKDPSEWAGSLEEERDRIIQEVSLNDSKDSFLNCHQGELTDASSSGTFPASLSNTLAQTPNTPSNVAVRQVEAHAFGGFPPSYNLHDTVSQKLCVESESFPVSKYHQNTELFGVRSDEDHSLEAQYETDKEMSSKTEGSGKIKPRPSRKSEEENVKELVIQKEKVNSYLPYQPGAGCSEHRTANLGKLDGCSPLESCDHSGLSKKELGGKSFMCTTLHLQEDEEDDSEGSQTHSLKEMIQTKHVKSSEQLEDKHEKMEEEREGDLHRKTMEYKIKAKSTQKLRHSDAQEEQEWGTQIRKTPRKEEQKDGMASSQDMLGLDTVYNLKNTLHLPDLNESSAFPETEGFALSFKVFSPSHCLDSNVETTAMSSDTKPVQYPGNTSPSTQSQICHEFRELESSGRHDQEVFEHPTDENRVSGNVEGQKSNWIVDGEGMAILCKNPNSQDLHYSKSRECTGNVELHICTSMSGITRTVGPAQKDSGKEPSDGNYMLCEESDSIEEPANKKLPVSWQMDLVTQEEALTLDSDTVVQASSKNGTCDKNFDKYSQSSICEIHQSVSPEEGRSTTKDNVDLTTLTSLSPQKGDFPITYLEEHQHVETSMNKFQFLGEEAAIDTFCMKHEVSINDSSCLPVLEEGRTEFDHNTDISSFPTTDMAQLKESSVPMSISNQCLALEPASSHFDQLSLSPPCCSTPVQLLTSPDNIDLPAQPKADIPHSRCLHHSLEQVPSCNQTCVFPTALKKEKSRSDTELSDQCPNPECDFNQYSQSPDPVSHSEQFVNNQLLPMPIVLQKLTDHCIFSEHTGNQSIQRDDFNPIKEHTEYLMEYPAFTANRPFQTSNMNKLPSLAGNQFFQQLVEMPESNVSCNCTESNRCEHTTVPIANFFSQSRDSSFKSESLAKNQTLDNRVEENPVLQMAKLARGAALQSRKDGNIPETSCECKMLDTHSDIVILGNYASAVDSTGETMPQVMDVLDGKSSFDHTFNPSLDRQKKCEATESKTSRQPPTLLAFTNPIHFLQLGPPSPPARYPSNPQADFQEIQWQQEQAGFAKTATFMAKDTGSPRKGLEKSVMEPISAIYQKTDRVAKHPALEKSSSCPYTNVALRSPKESALSSKTQEVLVKHRSKSKDWHRHGMRKISIPTENELDMIASFVPSKGDAHEHKDKRNHLEQVQCGEKKPEATVENIKRRHSKLINSSKVLYQEYSDVILNKAIQSQKRADSLIEDVELGSASSLRLQRKVLPLQDSYPQRLSVSSTASLWQDIPKVRESTMLQSMTREEQKLQEAKFELIASEASYLRSLNVAVDHFQHAPELQAVLTNQDRQWLFSRLQDVRDVSANFLFDLEEKLEENMFSFNVCDVALRHASEFRRVYLPYVTNQAYQEQTFKRLLNGVPAFQQVLERLESDPVCQRLSLKSFLILPFQRITRLKLLLQNILKRTQPGAEEEIQATQAYDALEKLIKDCNENVQRMKSTEELIHLSQNMEFECKIFPLISQSRRLVKCGELTALEYNLSVKWKLTTRSIYLHLFNDYLLLSRPKENGRFIVFDYAASSDVRGEKCEMKLHGANKNVFRLFLLQNNQGKKVEFLFRTEIQSEKLRWISALSPQQTERDLLNDSDTPQVQCVKSYKARENDELALEKADIIIVLRHTTDGWIEGMKLSDGERGWFPSDHVEFISCKHVRQMNLREEQRVKNAKQQVFHRK